MTALELLLGTAVLDAVQTVVTVKLFRSKNDPLVSPATRPSRVVGFIRDLSGKGLSSSEKKRTDRISSAIAAFLARPGVSQILGRLVLQARRQQKKNRWRKYL